jgi:hypothetical protein
VRWNHFNPAITTNQTFQEYKKERKKDKTETGERKRKAQSKRIRERERKECVAAEFVFAEFLPRHRGVGGPFAKDFSGRGRSGRIRLDINLLLETGWVASVYAHTHNHTHIHRNIHEIVDKHPKKPEIVSFFVCKSNKSNSFPCWT